MAAFPSSAIIFLLGIASRKRITAQAGLREIDCTYTFFLSSTKESN